MSFNELITYIIFLIGFALTPGPNMMLYLAYTFEYGRKAGWATAAGIVSSFIIHITAVILVLAALLVTIPTALNILSYCGIAYLLYLAIENLRIVHWKDTGESKEIKETGHFYLKGFMGNLLNPGSFVLYFSIIPQFIHPERGNVIAQGLILGVLQMLVSFTTNCLIVFFAGYVTGTFFKNEKYQKWVRAGMSVLIVLFAIKLLFSKAS